MSTRMQNKLCTFYLETVCVYHSLSFLVWKETCCVVRSQTTNKSPCNLLTSYHNLPVMCGQLWLLTFFSSVYGGPQGTKSSAPHPAHTYTEADFVPTTEGRQETEAQPPSHSAFRIMMELSYQSMKVAHQAREAVSEIILFCSYSPILRTNRSQNIDFALTLTSNDTWRNELKVSCASGQSAWPR